MSKSPASTAPHEEKVRHLAHLIWQQEGCPDGRAEAHWLAAEAQVRGEGEIVATPAKKPARKPAPKAKSKS